MLTVEQNLKLNHIIADRLLERLEFIPFQPDNILEFGFIDAYLIDKLAIYYPTAELYSLCGNNIEHINCSNKHNIFASHFQELPLANNSLDLIVSNLSIDCLHPDLDKYFQELHRIIRPDGLLLFTMLNVDQINYNQFLKVGDLLLANKFCDPVIDQELININYRSEDREDPDCEKMIAVEIFYGHALGSNLIKTPINIDS
jgi:malonyl-CoA O-methyltransferase